MIATVFFYLFGIIFNILNSILPAWNPWPASAEHAFTLFGQYSYWLDPWLPMQTFWAIMLYDASLMILLIPFVIFSRALRLKIFNKN
jgi:hypothetical protein